MIGGGDGQAGEGFFDPKPGIVAELLAGEGEAGEVGESLATLVASKKQPIAAADGVTKLVSVHFFLPELPVTFSIASCRDRPDPSLTASSIMP